MEEEQEQTSVIEAALTLRDLVLFFWVKLLPFCNFDSQLETNYITGAEKKAAPWRDLDGPEESAFDPQLVPKLGVVHHIKFQGRWFRFERAKVEDAKQWYEAKEELTSELVCEEGETGSDNIVTITIAVTIELDIDFTDDRSFMFPIQSIIQFHSQYHVSFKETFHRPPPRRSTEIP